MYIRKTKVKGKTYYQIAEKKKGKTVIITHLGTIEDIYKKFKESKG